MTLRASQACRAMIVLAVAATGSMRGMAQAGPAGSRLPEPSRVDLYGGYAYFHPVNSGISGYTYQPVNSGAVASVSGYFNSILGVQAEGTFSPQGSTDCAYTAQVGFILRFQYGRLVPFAHLLAGGAKIGGPVAQPCLWGFGAKTGLGLDYILPLPALRNRLAIRAFQADAEYSDVNYGANTVPLNTTGGVGKVLAYRLSAGLVLRLGDVQQHLPAFFGCTAQPVSAYAGEPIDITGSTLNLDSGRKLKPVYTWKTTGGVISGGTENATVATAGLAPGDYTVTGRVSEGSGATQHAVCTASFRIAGYDAPTITCSSNPTSIPPGGFSTITSAARSTQNRPLSYSYSTTAGQITGTGPTGTLSTPDVSPGTVTISCNVVDDQGRSAAAVTSITVADEAAPPTPVARNLCSVSFERDRRRPVRVDDEARRCLDDIAQTLDREPDATLVIIGKHDPQEQPDAAAQRVLNVKQYIVVERGIDPVRIQMRTGENTSRSVDNVLVPAGVTWDAGSTSTFDSRAIQREGEPYARPR